MKATIYVLIGVLLLVIPLSDREGNVGVTAWIGIILLVITLVGLNVKAASRTRPIITTLTRTTRATTEECDEGRPRGFTAAGAQITRAVGPGHEPLLARRRAGSQAVKYALERRGGKPFCGART